MFVEFGVGVVFWFEATSVTRHRLEGLQKGSTIVKPRGKKSKRSILVPRRLELPAFGVLDRCSNQLSYETDFFDMIAIRKTQYKGWHVAWVGAGR